MLEFFDGLQQGELVIDPPVVLIQLPLLEIIVSGQFLYLVLQLNVLSYDLHTFILHTGEVNILSASRTTFWSSVNRLDNWYLLIGWLNLALGLHLFLECSDLLLQMSDLLLDRISLALYLLELLE